jgi:hypothetical protein
MSKNNQSAVVFRLLTSSALFVCVAMLNVRVDAVTLTWDANASPPPNGGAGTWDTSSTRW